MQRKLLGPDHPDEARTLNNLGTVLRDEARLEEAETVHREALAMRRKLFGDTHPDVAVSLSNLALVAADRGRLGDRRLRLPDLNAAVLSKCSIGRLGTTSTASLRS
jgi:serine/threonine-protein kinase